MYIVIRHPDDFGTAIAEFRAARALSQAELAHRVGLNRTYLSNVEHGAVPAYVERFVALCHELGLSITISDS